MSKLSLLLNKTEDELFKFIVSTFKEKITTWDYFVDWTKVLSNVESIETELNILNTLIGKHDLRNECISLCAFAVQNNFSFDTARRFNFRPFCWRLYYWNRCKFVYQKVRRY